MQKRAATLIAASALLLAACEDRNRQESAATTQAIPAVGDVPVERGLAINTPEFEGRLNIPGLSVASEDMDLDGMELPPGSR
jgi:hypothetical protein